MLILLWYHNLAVKCYEWKHTDLIKIFKKIKMATKIAAKIMLILKMIFIYVVCVLYIVVFIGDW